MIARWLLAAFLLAHAAIHAGFLSRPPATPGGPPWPFELGRSWVLSPLGLGEGTLRVVGVALVVAVVAAFAVAGLATTGVIPATLFSPAAVAGSVASLALLAVFFHPWLVLGVGIDLAILWVLLVNRWSPESLTT